ncbi:MAG: ribosomal-processing cysteine protease Prp [Bacillota bacterium]
MTTVKLLFIGENITEVECKGHTGYAKHGQDIVCAAVSSIIQTALLGLTKLCESPVEQKVGDGYIKFSISTQTEQDRVVAQAILQTMRYGVLDLVQGYHTYIKLEETRNVY